MREPLATGYITSLLQEALVVTSVADIKNDLLTIQDKETKYKGMLTRSSIKEEIHLILLHVRMTQAPKL